jgi:hypothetical protein
MSCDHPASVRRRLADGDTLTDLRGTPAAMRHVASCADCAAVLARAVAVAESVWRGEPGTPLHGDPSWAAVRDGIRRAQRQRLIVRISLMAAAAAIMVVAFAGIRRIHPPIPLESAGGVQRDAQRVEELAALVVAHLAEDAQLESRPFWEGRP